MSREKCRDNFLGIIFSFATLGFRTIRMEFISSNSPADAVYYPAASMLETYDSMFTQTVFYTKIGKAYLVEARCRFHHPVDRCAPTLAAKETQQNVKLTLAGLPRREGSVHCPYYMKTGACKYGATCKSNHPPPGEVMASVISTVTSTAEEAKRERGAAVSKKSVSLSVI